MRRFYHFNYQVLFKNITDSDRNEININAIWHDIKISFEGINSLFDEMCQNTELESQIKAELVLRLLNELCTISDDKIIGAEAFLNETTLSRNLIYSDKTAFQRLLSRFHRFNKPAPFINFKGNDICVHSEAFSIEHSNLLIENTPLSDFIFSHMYIEHLESNSNCKEDTERIGESAPTSPSDDNPDNSILSADSTDKPASPADSSSKTTTHRYSFNKNGRYFLSVLLRSINSGIAPYTVNAQNGLSLKSLNTLFEKLYKAYNSKELKNMNTERYLLLYNAESIFQASYLFQIFESYVAPFSDTSQQLLEEFIDSFEYLAIVNDFCINSVKSYLWRENSMNFFTFSKKDSTPKKGTEYLSSLMEETIQCSKILDKIYEILAYYVLSIHGAVSSETEAQEDTLLNACKSLTNYLSSCSDKTFGWSYLSKSSYYPLASFYNEYLDFYTTYIFYSPTGIQSAALCIKNLIWSNDKYLLYLINRK